MVNRSDGVHQDSGLSQGNEVIRLRSVTAENWQACADLTISPEQAGFVPSNLYSIAEAQFYPDARSRAVYADDALVGYALYGRDDTGDWRIFRLMIDQNFQGRGYGRAAVMRMIKELEQCGAKEVSLSYEPNNHVAQKLYADLGFVEQGFNEKGRMTARLILGKGA
jgi:ribosomal protein S18 acetylase RimI-like enzyme